jgi:hypothetical protein
MATKKSKAKAKTTSKTAAAATGTVSNTQTTALTPNSNCAASGAGDTNNTTTVQFMAPGNGLVWWTAVVSAATKSAFLVADTGNAVVTFKSGLTITYVASGTGGAYNVFLSGNIVDNGTGYSFTGSVVYMSTGASSSTVNVA